MKELKENKDNIVGKAKLIEIAYNQYCIKERDIEYFKMIFKLVRKKEEEKG